METVQSDDFLTIAYMNGVADGRRFATKGGLIMTPEQRTAFEEAARPLMKWLNENCHPHTTIIMEHTNAQVFEGIQSFNTEEYLRK